MSVFVLTTLIVYLIFALGKRKTVTSEGITVNTEIDINRDTQTFFFVRHCNSCICNRTEICVWRYVCLYGIV